ncbi:PepSY domain-containing protein [Ruegeria arenilitoris]|uniref:PepSY domain-containing protein n=1 Tax=Ruegeria arenilitoris TaxID=1173585 RepID=UPI001C2B78FB|nr:PepSY domain-containing protein [Ruegeria arenilitoris]
MRKLALITLIAMATPALAQDLSTDTVLGTTMEQVTSNLTEMGYEVRKAEMEEGKIEVYFVKDKTMGEVYVSPETGKIIKLETK